MPLQKLQLRPGINRESTTLANEGTWFEMDKVRFRSGYPEKIGGWVKDNGPNTSSLKPSTGTLWGVCRSLWSWLNLAGFNLMGLGTNLKYYIQNGTGGGFYDVTPLRSVTPSGAVTFAATSGSAVITVTDAGHGAQTGDFVTFSGAVGLGGNITAGILNAEHQITYFDTTTYFITVSVAANASDVGNGGPSVIAAYQITTGSAIFTSNVGWGAGGWGGFVGSGTPTGWGSPSTSGVSIGQQLRLWSESNFGQNLVLNPRGGALYYWVVDNNPNVFNRAQVLSPTNTNTQNSIQYWLTDADCPSVCNFVMVSDSSRFVVAFGCNDYDSAILDPMLVRWSDAENVLVWQPLETNDAGSYRLSHGSEIIGAMQARQEILIWTDAALYSMQFTVEWGFQILADNISIASPNAMTTAANITYWMGLDKFYMYSGRVETLYCPLRQYIFGDINLQQQYQFFAGTNEGFNEVWWFYCSANSTVIDRYVIYNHLERIWSYGNLTRTAWLDTALRDYPSATGSENGNAILIYHEQGVDDASVNPPAPISAYIQSADFDIGDGHNYGFGWRMIPDITFDGSTVNNPSVVFTLRPRQNPGANYNTADTPTVTSAQNYQSQRNYTVQQFTQIVYTRIRGRQMAFKVSSDGLGVQWQLGVPSLDIRPDGRR
jgi:hypothetical protein